ncbi:hypothetical protein BDV96DRAFT_650312 [Lophiotrema nucula]|uniref:Fucose-specific lectin n=1 Tax=Lophiotrema nucula TaxID=690887 RepID=A0A6A5YYL4_9PLEO|nr:hypothetical protein BDV96DRAFT_650312 [Lophiotrema nucula]
MNAALVLFTTKSELLQYAGNDTDYSSFQGGNATPVDDRKGMNIWFAADDSTFEQYAWYEEKDGWVEVKQWPGMNVHAGVACYSWDKWLGGLSYAMMVNKKNMTEFWWKDTNTTHYRVS